MKKSGNNLLVKILDNGIGMSPEVLHNLFKFNGSATKTGTSGEKGTGLGLYLCKEFVEENDGSLIIHSHENAGTEVVVSLVAGLKPDLKHFCLNSSQSGYP